MTRAVMARWLLPAWLLLVSTGVDAAFFERLLMPGPLASVHAELEDDCANCHFESDQAAQGERCLACHDHRNIALDIDLGAGLHGRLGEMKAKGCKLCHGEHRGRDADILGFQPLTFDHDRSDFPLRASHREVPCTACHSPDSRYAEADSRCVDCHGKSDAHGGRLGEHCADCHGEDSWTEVRFDHDEATSYRLVGKHREVSCTLCHIGSQYREIPTGCVSCHRIDDPHLGKKGDRCEDCHDARDWEDIAFDHARETKFRLAGRHKEIACASCHKASDVKQKRDRKCLACHRSDDVHKGRNGTRCEQCHNQSAWTRTVFDHARKTEFRLEGRHSKLACIACHKGEPKDEKDQTDCVDCHRQADVHQGVMSQDCESCHAQEDWTKVDFKHGEKSGYRLTGGHERAPCTECHTLAVSEQTLSSECYDCHRRDDPHEGRQGADCIDCHTVQDWHVVDFEHDISPFPLLGQHAVVACEACHESAVFQQVESECDACHQDQDEHRGTLGDACGDCHNPNSWSAWLFDHEQATGYALRGPHEDIHCADCHTVVVKAGVAETGSCYNCHRTDDRHNGGFGYQCERCHQDDSFSEIRMSVR